MVDMAMIAHYNQSFGDKSLPSEPSNGQLEQSSGTEGEIAFQVYLLLQEELKRLLSSEQKSAALINELTLAKQAGEQKIEELDSQNEHLSQENASLNEMNSKLSRTCKKMIAANKMLKEEIDQLSEEVEKLKRSVLTTE